MPKEQSEACPYKSRFSGAEDLFLSPGQYLAENMTARMARKDKVDLPVRFWELEKWKRVFLQQLRHAHGLLKLYSVEAIVRALRTRKGMTLYSLGAKFALDPLVRDEQEKLNRQKEAAAEAPATEPEGDEVATSQAPRPVFQPTNSRPNLKDL